MREKRFSERQKKIAKKLKVASSQNPFALSTASFASTMNLTETESKNSKTLIMNRLKKLKTYELLHQKHTDKDEQKQRSVIIPKVAVFD